MTKPGDPIGASDSSEPAEESPGVPGFRTWRSVYVFVFAAFVLVVIGLAILARVYA